MDSPRHISAFDLDHTLLSKNSSFQFGLRSWKKGLLPFKTLFYLFWGYLGHTLGIISLEQINQRGFRAIFQGLFKKDVNQWVESFLQESFDKMLYLPAVSRLRQAQKNGHLTVILSSSPNIIVESIAKRFNVTLWESTHYSVDSDERFSHILHIMQGVDKAKFIENLCEKYKLTKENVTAYSDSHLDLPFLLAAGHPVGVNPDRQLKAVCKRKKWEIL